jgi:hypothetical protein
LIQRYIYLIVIHGQGPNLIQFETSNSNIP